MTRLAAALTVVSLALAACGEDAAPPIADAGLPDVADSPTADGLFVADQTAPVSDSTPPPDSGAPPADAGPIGKEASAPKPDSAPPKQKAKLKVMTYNIKGSAQNPSTLNNLATFIAQQDPDLVGMQEVYNYVAQGANQAAIVAAALSTLHGKKYTTYYLQQHSFVVAGIGVAVLSKYPIASTTAHNLPKVESENRVVLRAVISTPLRQVDFFVTHLTNQSAVVYTQAQDLASWVSGFSGKPKILVGDFNASPTSNVYSLLTKTMVDTWASVHGGSGGGTIPSDKPGARIDFIFVDNASNTKALSSQVAGNATLSDHLAVVSTVEIEK